MNKIYALLLFMPLLTVTVAVAQNNNTPYDVFYLDNSYYSEESGKSWYVYLTEGEYHIAAMAAAIVENTGAHLTITLRAVEGDYFTPVSRRFDLNSVVPTSYSIENIRIARKASYRVEAKFSGAYLPLAAIATPKGKGGKMRFAKQKTAPTVRLRYLPEDEKQYEYDWFYGEMFVPEGYNPAHTLYVCTDFGKGFFGLRFGSDAERSVLFSVRGSSSVRPEERVLLMDKGADVYGESFSSEANEGSSYRKYPWKIGILIKFLTNVRKLPDGAAIYSAWFMDGEAEGWQYVASWKAPRENRYFDGLRSYIENIDGATGNKVRKANYYNMWGRCAGDRRWIAFTKATMAHPDSGPDSRRDYAGGVSKTNPFAFYLSSGGFTEPVDVADDEKVIAVKNVNAPPAVDVAALSAAVDSAIARKVYLDDVGVIPNRKVRVSSAEASSAQPGDEADKSIDGNTASLYHSDWNNTPFPVTLTYRFDSVEAPDYAVYCPRTDGGSNGNFKETEVWISTAANPEFVKVGTYNFEGKSSSSKISFPKGVKFPGAIRFVVSSGEGNFASCAEMIFYARAEQPSIPPVFTDETCSELRPGVGLQDIAAIKNGFYRKLAASLFDKTYPAEFRVQQYKPYPTPEVAASQNKTSTYGLLNNATGICVTEDDHELVVFVGNTGGEDISLRLVDFEKGFAPSSVFLLSEGANRFKCEGTGLLYVMYHTANPAAKPITIHIATGTVNGYYDVDKHDSSDWSRLLGGARAKQLDVLGKYAHVTFPTASFRQYTPDVGRLIQVYDSIAWLEQRFIGLYKYNRANANRMHFIVEYNMPSGWGAYATAYRTAYPTGSMSDLCSAEILRTTAVWGPAHEVGHVNQTRPGFRWGGMGEVSNNVYSMYVQHAFGNRSRLAAEGESGYGNRYEKGFTEMLAAKALHATYKDVFCKLIPFWQLELYCSQVKGKTDFYADVHEQIRLRPDPATDGDAILQFVTVCCDAAQEDLTDFFKAWGLLAPMDYKGAYAGYGSGRLSLTCTPEQVEEVVRYAKKYPKPEVNVQYIHDDCINAYRNPAKIVQGSAAATNDSIKMEGWENVVVFEVYDKNRLAFISPLSEFKIPASVKNPVVYAVPVKGEKVKVKVKRR